MNLIKLFRNFFFLTLFISGLINAQSINQLEKKLGSLQYLYSLEKYKLDSLKVYFNIKVKEIDEAKKTENVNEDMIKELMAGTATLSNKIDNQQLKTANLETEIETIKKNLDEKYTSIIDSLISLEQSDNYNGNKDDLRNRILSFTEKKLLVTPKVYSLSFVPERILKINPDNAQSTEEKAIYEEYVSEALTEVDNHLKRIEKLNKEVNQIITLQEKAAEFLEETEFDSDVRTSTFSTGSQPSYTDELVSLEGKERLGTQIQSFTFLLNQLDFTQKSEFESRNSYSLDSLRSDLTITEYQKLLQEVEKRLTDYRLILKHKIGNSQ